MRTMKKALSLLLAVLMLASTLSLCVISASAAETENGTSSGDYLYKFTFDEVAENTVLKDGGSENFVTNLSDADSNPNNFANRSSMTGKIIADGKGGNFFRTDYTTPSGYGSSGDWKGIQLTFVDENGNDYTITGGISIDFKFRWIGGKEVADNHSIALVKLRRKSWSPAVNLLTGKVNADGDLEVTLQNGTLIKTFKKNSTDFSDISVKYYDATATYSVYIDGVPYCESMFIGTNYMTDDYISTSRNADLMAIGRKRVSGSDNYAIEFGRITDTAIACGFCFDMDDFYIRKEEAATDRTYYYKNSFDSLVYSTESNPTYNGMSVISDKGTYKFRGTTANMAMATETVGDKTNGYFAVGSGAELRLLDYYQLFQDGNWTATFKLRGNVTAGENGAVTVAPIMNLYNYNNTNTLLYLDSDGYLSLGHKNNKSPIAKVPGLDSGKWVEVTVSCMVTNKNKNTGNFIGGNPSNGRYSYALWVDGELCGTLMSGDSGTAFRTEVSSNLLITNYSFAKTTLTAMPTADDLSGFTLYANESSDTLKVYKNEKGDFYQLKGTTSNGVFTFSSGVKVVMQTKSGKVDYIDFGNATSYDGTPGTDASLHIDDLEVYSGINHKRFALAESDTMGIVNEVKFAKLTSAISKNIGNCYSTVASGNGTTSMGGTDGVAYGWRIDDNYVTRKVDGDKNYVTLSNLTASDTYYDLHITNTGGKMFSAKLTLRNLVSSGENRLFRFKRQSETATSATFFDTLYTEATTGNLYFKMNSENCYLVDKDGKNYSVAGSDWVTPEIIIDDRGNKTYVTFLVDGVGVYYKNSEGISPAKSLYLGGDGFHERSDAIDQRVVLYRIDSYSGASVDIYSGSVEYVSSLPDIEDVDKPYLDKDAAAYVGKLYSAEVGLKNVAYESDSSLFGLRRSDAEETSVTVFDTLFVEANTGNLYFEDYRGVKRYLVNEQRVRYSVAGEAVTTPKIIFDERGEKILVTFLVDGKVAYYDSENGLVPAASLYIGGDLIKACSALALHKIRIYNLAVIPDETVVDNASAKLEIVSTLPEVTPIKWADEVYLDFSEIESLEELGDQFEWTDGVRLENGVLKIPAGGSFKWIDYNAVLIDYLENHTDAVNGQYINGFTIEMKVKATNANSLVRLDRGAVKNDILVYMNNGYVHMSGGQNSGYAINTVGSDRFTELTATFTTEYNEVNVFADGYLLGISRYTNFHKDTDRLAKIAISGGEIELSELRIHRDLEREMAAESGELFKLDADMLDPAIKSGEYRINTAGVMAPGVLKNPTVTSRLQYIDEETGENFYYFHIAPDGTVKYHTHTDFFLNGYLEDKVTVFEYKFRYTPDDGNKVIEMCQIRRTEDGDSTPLWDDLFIISSAGYYAVVGGRLCDAEGNLLVASSEDWNELAIVYDVDAGLVSYRLNGKIPYYKSGDTVALADGIQLPNFRYYRMDSAETQVRTIGIYADSKQILDVADINVYTVSDTATAEYIGVQTATDSNAVRIVAGLDMLYYANAGFDVRAYSEDGEPLADLSKTYTTNKVYSSIIETVDGEECARYPQKDGYRYFMTANVTDIPTDEVVRLSVTPFTVVNGVKLCGGAVMIDIDIYADEPTSTNSKNEKPVGTNTSGNFSTTEIVKFTNDGALELNGLDAEFAFGANLDGGIVSVNLTNAKGEVAEKTVIDIYVDGVLKEEGVELDFGRHTLVLAENLYGEHSFKIVKRSGGDFICINTMSFNGEFLEKAPALSAVGGVNVVVKSPDSKTNAKYGDVYVYAQTSDESGNYYIMYIFKYLNYGMDERLTDGDASTVANYSSGGGNTPENCHMYRVREAFIYKQNEDGSYTKICSLLHQGEISVAIKEFYNQRYATDFVGGYHGDENAEGFSFLIDGEPLDTTKAGTYNGLTTFELVQDTMINRCNEPDTPLLAHSQHFLVDSNGLRINRHIEVLADDFAPTHDQGYTMMATVYRTGSESKKDVDESSTDETVLAGGVRSYNVKKMSALNANGELADDTSVFDMTDGKYPYKSGNAYSVTCAGDTRLINRYAKYEGDKGVNGRVGYVVSDASMETKSTDIQVRITYGDNKWYACIGSYSATADEWVAATEKEAPLDAWKGLIVPKGEKWNLNTYYTFDYNTADIAK